MVDPNDISSETTTPLPWSSGKRFWISWILLFHLVCVLLAPLAMVPPRSSLALQSHQWVAPYSQTLYLNHGYRFFAPEPGPSHILEYDITQADGTSATYQFPNRNLSPRLMYHRWFMLSETVFQHVGETFDETQLADWKKQIEDEIQQLQQTDPRAADQLRNQLNLELNTNQQMAEVRDLLVKQIGQTLLRRHDGVSISMRMKTRLIATPADVLRGVSLDDPRYLPEDLQYNLGRLSADGDQLETILPEEMLPETGAGQGSNQQ